MPPDWTFVYVIVCKDGAGTSFSKIGISNDPEERLRSLRTASPLKLELLVGVPVPSREIAEWIEGSVHGFMVNDRVRGEWFKSDPLRCGIAICIAIESAYQIAGFSGCKLYDFLDASGATSALQALLEGTI